MIMMMRKETREVVKEILAIRGKGLAFVLKRAVTRFSSSYGRTTCQGSIELLMARVSQLLICVIAFSSSRGRIV